MLRKVLRVDDADGVRWSALTTPASYVIGGVAAYWMIERIAGFWA